MTDYIEQATYLIKEKGCCPHAWECSECVVRRYQPDGPCLKDEAYKHSKNYILYGNDSFGGKEGVCKSIW